MGQKTERRNELKARGFQEHPAKIKTCSLEVKSGLLSFVVVLEYKDGHRSGRYESFVFYGDELGMHIEHLFSAALGGELEDIDASLADLAGRDVLVLTKNYPSSERESLVHHFVEAIGSPDGEIWCNPNGL